MTEIKETILTISKDYFKNPIPSYLFYIFFVSLFFFLTLNGCKSAGSSTYSSHVPLPPCKCSNQDLIRKFIYRIFRLSFREQKKKQSQSKSPSYRIFVPFGSWLNIPSDCLQDMGKKILTAINYTPLFSTDPESRKSLPSTSHILLCTVSVNWPIRFRESRLLPRSTLRFYL